MIVVNRLNSLKYDFEKKLKEKQLEMQMNNVEFAAHLGMHKSWLLKLWSRTEPRHPLSEKTMSQIKNRVGIDYDVMLQYNEDIMRERGQI